MAIPTNRRQFLSGTAAVATALVLPRYARSEGIRRTIRIGTVNPAASATGQACSAFAAAVAASPILSRMMQIEVIAGGSLGGELEMAQACINGSLELAVTASNVVAAIVPQLGLLDAPFLFRDAAHARSVLDGPIGEEFSNLMRANGAYNLAWAENGLRHITANKPIRTLDDLRGLHIRVPQSKVMLEAFNTLGCNAEPLPFPQLFEALRTGRFEAQENPVATIVSANFAQVQKYLNLTGHVYSAAFFIASPDLLEDLGAEERVALIAAAKIGARASRDTASNGERDGIVKLRSAGMIIVEDVNRQALSEAARPAFESIANQLGADLGARIRAFKG